MATQLKIPQVGESIKEVVIQAWLKKEGDTVAQDEPVVELETDKATVELPAPAAGKLVKIIKNVGDSAAVGDVIGEIGDGVAGKAEKTTEDTEKGKRIKKEIQTQETLTRGETKKEEKVEAKPVAPQPAAKNSDAREERVRMSPLRRRIAQHLVEAQQNAALLTTFNEIDMSAVIEFRQKYGEHFQKQYGVKLGFMSFFVKATIDALKQFPQLNAYIDGDEMVYHHYYDIGIAISTEKGLVVPVLRDADGLSFAETESAIAEYAQRAREGKLKVEDLTGGTFTITNGGIFGSLLSTPIVNPPQSGILGMHAIQDRPVAIDKQVVIRPMMYAALTYDHRIVDGREAVTFLKRLKETIENPLRMLIEV